MENEAMLYTNFCPGIRSRSPQSVVAKEPISTEVNQPEFAKPKTLGILGNQDVVVPECVKVAGTGR